MTQAAKVSSLLISNTGRGLAAPLRRPYTAIATGIHSNVKDVRNELKNVFDANENYSRIAIQGSDDEHKLAQKVRRTVKSEEIINKNECLAEPILFQETERKSTLKDTFKENYNIGQTKCNRNVVKWTGLMSGQNIPCHSLVSLLKLDTQQIRGYVTETCKDPPPGVASCAPKPTKELPNRDKCAPKKIIIDPPMPCVLKRKPAPPCTIPVQKKWEKCELTMCLPCCDKVEKPFMCRQLDIKLNSCPRKTYRIPSYSECHKRHGRPGFKKECCYYKKICYAKAIAEREIIPLISVKERQAIILGKHHKTPEEAWGT